MAFGIVRKHMLAARGAVVSACLMRPVILFCFQIARRAALVRPTAYLLGHRVCCEVDMTSLLWHDWACCGGGACGRRQNSGVARWRRRTLRAWLGWCVVVEGVAATVKEAVDVM